VIPTDVLERYAQIRAFLPDGARFPGDALAALALAWLTVLGEELVGTAERVEGALDDINATLCSAHDEAPKLHAGPGFT
jgi:hypothetical protein